MDDSSPPAPTTEDRTGFKMALPTVLCTPDPPEPSDPINTSMVSSESKLSLPANLGTPTSPLHLSSPAPPPPPPTPPPPSSPLTNNLSTGDSRAGSPQQLTSPTATPQNIVGSATGNPRNKCALQPGHSLMHWIRLGNSGRDLAGVGGRVRPVSPEELVAHNTENDAWLAIRGRVYNVTHYLPYHPGGVEELVRGAGSDATQLFDGVHPWVNYDSLLAKCLVGPLRCESPALAPAPGAEQPFHTSSVSPTDTPTPTPKSDRLKEPSKAQELVRKSMENLANCITPVRKKMAAKSDDTVKGSPPSKIMQSLIQSSDLPVSISRRGAASPASNEVGRDAPPPPLRHDWIQTSTKLTIYVYTGPLANPGGCAGVAGGCLLIQVASDGWLRTLRVVPEAPLREPLQLRVFAESGKIEMTALKREPSLWKRCGEATLGAPTPAGTPASVRCRVTSVHRLSHDTTLMSIAPAPGPALVPIGHHVRVHMTIDGSECVRAYTPLGEGWGRAGAESAEGASLRLAVKRYRSGTLSPRLAALAVGDAVCLSGPYGNFQLQKLKPVRRMFLLAAGTGITPMLALIRFMLSRSNPRCERIHLMFFNKTEEDILFNSTFEQITAEDERFQVTNVLSEAGGSWRGRRGRVEGRALAEVFGEASLRCGAQCARAHFACLCGPAEFSHAALRALRALGTRDACIHAFMG